MSPSKLDARHRARDFRVDPDQSKQRRHEGGRKLNLHHVYKDVTTITYLQNRPDEDSRYVVLDELPEMDETWIEKTVIVRSPVGGVPDRAFIGVQMPDDTLAWIEISIMSPAPPTTGGGGGVPGAPTHVWDRSLALFIPSVGQFNTVTLAGIDISGEPQLWFGGPTQSRIIRSTITGSMSSIPLPTPVAAVAYASGIAVQQSNNHAWIGDIRNERVQEYNASGIQQGSWVPSGLDNPVGLAFNAGESLMAVADNGTTPRVRIYNWPAQTLAQTLTSFLSPSGVDFDSSGNIYISDFARHVVYKYSSAYALLDTWGTLNATGTGIKEFNHPAGVHVDGFDQIYVADMYNNRIQLFEPDGDFLTSFGTFGSGDNQFSHPCDVTTTLTEAFVTDRENQRISIWTIS